MTKIKIDKNNKRDLIIEAGISAIPYIGGSLSVIYFGAKQERRFKRIETFYELIQNDFEKYKKSIIDIKNSNKNEMASLMEEINDGVEKDHLHNKIEYFKNCFFNILTEDSDEDKYRKRKYFIYLLSKMNEADIFYLSEMSKLEDDYGYRISGEEKLSEHDTSLEKLKSWGLVFSFLSQSLKMGENWGKMSNYSVSVMGREFCSFCLESKLENE